MKSGEKHQYEGSKGLKFFKALIVIQGLKGGIEVWIRHYHLVAVHQIQTHIDKFIIFKFLFS